MGAGQIQFHFGAAAHAVRSTMARFPDSIADGGTSQTIIEHELRSRVQRIIPDKSAGTL